MCNSVILTHSQSYATIILFLANCRIFLSPSDKLYTYQQSLFSLVPAPSSHWPIDFLSLQICLRWTFHINEIIHHVTYSVQLLLLNLRFSVFRHVKCICISFFFQLKNIILYGYTTLCLFTHQLMEIWVSTLGLL